MERRWSSFAHQLERRTGSIIVLTSFGNSEAGTSLSISGLRDPLSGRSHGDPGASEGLPAYNEIRFHFEEYHSFDPRFAGHNAGWRRSKRN